MGLRDLLKRHELKAPDLSAIDRLMLELREYLKDFRGVFYTDASGITPSSQTSMRDFCDTKGARFSLEDPFRFVEAANGTPHEGTPVPKDSLLIVILFNEPGFPAQLAEFISLNRIVLRHSCKAFFDGKPVEFDAPLAPASVPGPIAPSEAPKSTGAENADYPRSYRLRLTQTTTSADCMGAMKLTHSVSGIPLSACGEIIMGSSAFDTAPLTRAKLSELVNKYAEYGYRAMLA